MIIVIVPVIRLLILALYMRVYVLLWSPYGIGQTIIFLPCDF